MKYIYTFYIWTIGLILFGIVAIFIIIAYVLVNPKKFSPVFKFIVKFFTKLLFIRVQISGQEQIAKDKPCIIMPNHVSFMDAVILAAFTPFHTIGIEDQSHFSWPLFGWLIKLHGNLAIDRKNPMSSRKTYAKAEELLKDGAHLVVFPEGGRTADGKLRPFKKLPFIMAKNAEADLFPVGLNGVYEFNNKTSWLLKPGKIHLVYGSPLKAADLKHYNVDELSHIMHAKVRHLLEEEE